VCNLVNAPRKTGHRIPRKKPAPQLKRIEEAFRLRREYSLIPHLAASIVAFIGSIRKLPCGKTVLGFRPGNAEFQCGDTVAALLGAPY